MRFSIGCQEPFEGHLENPLNMSIEKEEKHHLQKIKQKKHIFFLLVGVRSLYCNANLFFLAGVQC